MSENPEIESSEPFEVLPFSTSGQFPEEIVSPPEFLFNDETDFEWSGVKSCADDGRVKQELGSVLQRFVDAQMAAHPDLKLEDSGYKILGIYYQQIKELFGRRHCRVTGRMARWVRFKKVS